MLKLRTHLMPTSRLWVLLFMFSLHSNPHSLLVRPLERIDLKKNEEVSKGESKSSRIVFVSPLRLPAMLHEDSFSMESTILLLLSVCFPFLFVFNLTCHISIHFQTYTCRTCCLPFVLLSLVFTAQTQTNHPRPSA